MDSEDIYESAWFQIKIREVLCTIVMMQDAIEIASIMNEESPFDIGKKSEFKIIKKLYRDIYKAKNMTADQVDEAVNRAIDLYNKRHVL